MAAVSICLEMIYQDVPLIDRFDLVASHGVSAVEFWEWWDHDVEELAERASETDLDIVAISANETALTDPAARKTAVAEITDSIDTATRLGCPNVIVLAGPAQSDLDRQPQRENVISVLDEVASTAEAAGVSCVLEPLNTIVDHPGHFLSLSERAFSIVKSVNSPKIKVLFDIYHQQVTEGNIIQTVTENIDTIDHIHIADVPGRHEPGTGELAYSNIVSAIESEGYGGHFGFEFSPQANVDTAIQSIVADF